MGQRCVDGIGSLTSAGAVNTSTATSRSAKIRANGPMCAAARGSSGNGPARSLVKTVSPERANDQRSSDSRARHTCIFALTRTQLRARSTRRELGFTAGRWLAFRASRPAGVRSRTSPARGETTAAQRRLRNAAESRGTFVRSRHGKQRARGPRARPSQQGVRGRAGVRRGVGTSHALQRHRLPRLWGGAEAPAQAHAGARCAPPIIDRAP